MVKLMGKILEVNLLPGSSSDLGKKTNSDVSDRKRVKGEADHAHFFVGNTCKL